MIILDTNVVSALMRREPDRSVLDWLDAQPAPSIWTTSITVFEIRAGIDLLVPSRRRHALEEAFQAMITTDFDGRILTFDLSAAQAAGALVAERQRAGRSMEIRDAQIAGITLARKATVATRNVRHFRDLGVPLVDPWTASATDS